MLTDEQFQEIKTNFEAGFILNAGVIGQLIAEIERLRADNLALVLAINDVINDGRAAGILERHAPEALRKLGDAFFTK